MSWNARKYSYQYHCEYKYCQLPVLVRAVALNDCLRTLSGQREDHSQATGDHGVVSKGSKRPSKRKLVGFTC